jgi:hypothetical protein
MLGVTHVMLGVPQHVMLGVVRATHVELLGITHVELLGITHVELLGVTQHVMLGVVRATHVELLGVIVFGVLYDGLGVSLRVGATAALSDGDALGVIDVLGEGRLNLVQTLVVPLTHIFLTLTIAVYTTPITLFNLHYRDYIEIVT